MSVVVADVNGDGKLDLVTANHDAASASVLLGNGTGGFANRTDLAVGWNPVCVAAADVSGDGMLDLVVANYTGDSVSVLLGRGNGLFAAKTDFAIPQHPASVAVGDFNGDGKADLATANYDNGSGGADTISVLLGRGGGGFAAAASYPAGAGACSVAVGDFDRDGTQDLATANGDDGSVSVFLGRGNGTFGVRTDLVTGLAPTQVIVGDFNGDGTEDLATADGFSSVSLLCGKGNGAFSERTAFSAGDGVDSLAAGDLNGDGALDLATTSRLYGEPGTVSILLGDGGGAFSDPKVWATADDPESVAIGDFNGDGGADLVTANGDSDTASVLLQGFSAAPTPTPTPTPTATPVPTPTPTPTPDISRPQPIALGPEHRTVRRGATVALPYIIRDAQPGSDSAKVTFAFYAIPVSGDARLVAVRRLGEKQTNRSYVYRFRCTLSPSYYLYMVRATDAAGNESLTSLDPKSAVFKRVCNQLRVR